LFEGFAIHLNGHRDSPFRKGFKEILSINHSKPSSVNTCGSFTSIFSMSRARRMYLRLNAFSSSFVKLLFPNTLVIVIPRRILLTPTIFATGGTAVICTMGIPIFSMADPIVAPQRLLDPQVDVRTTAWIPLFLSSTAISLPIFAQTCATVAFPEVQKKVGWSFSIFFSFSKSRMTSTGTNR
jgi:hypothetical protein